MNTQDRINQLANAALRAAPAENTAPKPATFTPRYQRAAADGSHVDLPQSEAQAQPVVQEPSPLPTSIEPSYQEHRSDDVIGIDLEAQTKRLKQKRARQSIIVNAAILTVLASLALWYSQSKSAQASVQDLIPDLKKSVEDVKSIGSMKDQYNDSLKQIASRSKEVDGASLSLGADPTQVEANDDPYMESESRELTGGDEGNAVHSRNQKFKENFGIVKALTAESQSEAQANK